MILRKGRYESTCLPFKEESLSLLWRLTWYLMHLQVVYCDAHLIWLCLYIYLREAPSFHSTNLNQNSLREIITSIRVSPGILFEHPQLHHHFIILFDKMLPKQDFYSRPVCSFLRPSVISPISFCAKHLAPIDQQTCSGRQSSSSWLRNPGRTTQIHSSKLFSLEFRTCQMIYR